MRTCLLAVLFLSACARALESTQLVAATGSDPVALWKTAASSAAQVVEAAIQRRVPNSQVELKDVDLEHLRIWNGQRLQLALEVDSTLFKFMAQPDPDWQALSEALPLAQTGVASRTDWDALQRTWVSPISQGPQLPDFVLEGPLDLYFRTPTALPLYLPHPVDVGSVSRVLLREGAAVTVRGARSVALRRPVDLPALSLGDFASLVTADAEAHPAAGILHLVAGVRSAAVQRWNATHPDLSLALVALELELSPHSAALLAAPAPAGAGASGLQRLKARRLKEGVVELIPRGEALTEEASRALAVAHGAPYAWPLRSLNPQHLQAYERLLREVLSTHVFGSAAAVAGGKDSSGGGARAVRDMQLRLHQMQSEAQTLLQLRVEVDRRPKPLKEKEGAESGQGGSGGAAGGDEKDAAGAAEGDEGAAGGEQQRQQQQRAQGGEGSQSTAVMAAEGEGSSMGQAPELVNLLTAPKYAPHEVWDAIVQVKRDPETGALKFVPVKLQRADATKQTVSFSPGALTGMVGNATLYGADMLAAHEEL